MTYTVATMDVLPSTHADIKRRLERAGYDHAIGDDDLLDMTHIAIQPRPNPIHDGPNVLEKLRSGHYRTNVHGFEPEELQRVPGKFMHDALEAVGLHDHPKAEEIYAFAARVGTRDPSPVAIIWALEQIAGFTR